MTIQKTVSGRAAVLAAAALFAGLSLAASPAEAAVVYCKTVGVPKGCVMRPTRVVYCTAPGLPAGCVVRATPVAGPNVVYCKRRGVPKGCVMR